MFCSQCGKQMQDGAKFCASCGTSLQGGAAPAQQPKSGAGLKLVVAGLVVAAAAAGGYAMLAPAPVEKTPAISPAPQTATPEPKPSEPVAEKPAEPPPPVAEPQPPAKDPADLAAAHKALDQRIADEEAAAKEASGKN